MPVYAVLWVCFEVGEGAVNDYNKSSQTDMFRIKVGDRILGANGTTSEHKDWGLKVGLALFGDDCTKAPRLTCTWISIDAL